MRKRLCVPFSAVLAAAALASCASAPPRPVLTVELFDSRSGPEPAAGGSDSVLSLPVPVVESVAEAPVPQPPAPRGATRSGPTQSADADSANTDGTAEPVLVSLLSPGTPRPATGLPLAQPAPPAVAAVPRQAAKPATSASTGSPSAAPAAPRSSSSQPAVAPQPSAKPATVQQPAAQQTSPRQTATQQSAVTPQPSATAQPTPVSAPADSYGRLREIYARAGDEMQIGLDGTGFLFLGFPDAQANSGGMSFKTKETRDGKTWFTFQALKLGTYDLDFLQQDNTNGSSARETVRVHVVSDQDFNAAVSSAQALNASSSASPEAGDPGFADRLSSAGAYEAAVTELLKGYQEGNPDLNDRIARLYLLMGSYEAAAKYYQKNLTPPGPLADAAVLGLVRVAAAQRDQVGLMAQLKRLLLIKDPAAEEPLILAMRLERDRAQVGVGLDLAAEYLSRYPDGQWRDEAEFTAAQLLEADSPFRDIAKARDFYRDVVSRYPVGDFAAPARERLQYIERHFYQIR